MAQDLAQMAQRDLTIKESEREIQKAVGWTRAQLQILMEAVIPKKGYRPADVVVFAYVCKRTGLDPFARQIYPIVYGGKPTTVTGIDGYRLVAHRTKLLAGIDAPRHESIVKEIAMLAKYNFKADGYELAGERTIMRPTTTYLTVHKILPEGRTGKFTGMVEWQEFAQYDNRVITIKGKPKATPILRDRWASSPKHMLAKCAEAQALRKLAPAELSGTYTDEELDVVIDVVGRPISDEPQALPKQQGEDAKAAPAKERGGAEAKRVWNMIMEHCGGNSAEACDMLEKLSRFEKDGKTFQARSWEKLSPGWAKKIGEAFEAKYGAASQK